MNGALTPPEFGDQFTVIPDTGITRLHCRKCAAGNDPAYFEVGYHPSLDVLTERARAHNQERHGSR